MMLYFNKQKIGNHQLHMKLGWINKLSESGILLNSSIRNMFLFLICKTLIQ